ncbi:MAG TPA: SRPBCC domain-containing protein [Actinomycetota bacterium]|nr:SRPBCC domain-containing protein [Actinomycetota bacterium]
MATETHDLVATRTLDAPVEQVWSAWTEPELVMEWWGPHGFTAPVAKMDVRVGATSLVAMRSPEGQDLYNTWTYEAVEPGRRLVFVTRFADQDGTAIDPTAQGLPPEMPSEVRTEVRFEELGARTEVTVTEYEWPAGRMMEMSKMGLEQTLDKMAELLAGSRSDPGS